VRAEGPRALARALVPLLRDARPGTAREGRTSTIWLGLSLASSCPSFRRFSVTSFSSAAFSASI